MEDQREKILVTVNKPQIIQSHSISRTQLVREENNTMETLKIPGKKENLNWDYDQEADVLYISIGKPVKALGLDSGEGVIIRYQEDTGEVVGVTIIGVRERAAASLTESSVK